MTGLRDYLYEPNPQDNLKAIRTPSKSGQTLFRATIRKHLKADEYFKFKARKKPFLSSKHKKARLRWAKEHRAWTTEDWYRIIWIAEATFETGLDTRSCYVTRKHGTAIELRYFKPTFKSRRSSISIWGGITLGLKGPVYFL